MAVNGLLVVGAGSPDADAASAPGTRRAAASGPSSSSSPIGADRGSRRRSPCGRSGERSAPDVGLRLDLNGELTERAAIDWLATLEALELEYVEQPIPATLGVDAMARVRAAIPMPLAADESVTDRIAASGAAGRWRL